MSGLLILYWRRHRLALVLLALALALFQWLITRLMPGPEQVELLRQMVGFMPDAIRSAIQDELLITITPQGFLAFGYVHPIVLVIMGAWVVRLTAGSLAGQIGLGTMDLLASRPVRRESFIAATALVMLAGSAVIVAAGMTGTLIGLDTRPVEGVTWRMFPPVIAGLWLLFAAFGALGLLISATRRTGGSASGWTSGLIAVMFAVEYVSRAWEPIRWMQPLTLFAYYHPQRTLTGGALAPDVAVLGIVAAVALALSLVVFTRRDL